MSDIGSRLSEGLRGTLLGSPDPATAAAPLPPEIERQLFDPARLPGLSASGRELLRWMRGHPCAPHYRDFSGHRLTRHEVWQARLRHAWLKRLAVPDWQPGQALPAWVLRHLRHCVQQVPAHAGKARVPSWPGHLPARTSLDDIATTSRADLAADLYAQVPRHVPVDEAICFSTSGSTGHPLRVPSHPQVACDYQAYHQRALQFLGLAPRRHHSRVGIVLAGYQQRCFTYVSVNPLRGERGLAKLNLHPAEWRDPGHRAAYLDALQPELMSGDPVSFSELMRVGMTHRPRALLSTSMALSPALRQALEQQFACPVADLYSLNEVGPVGVHVPRLEGFALLQPRLLVEIVDAQGRALPAGERGEITVTGGFNPYLPLLRYRTGDHAHWALTTEGLVLRGLEGRAPVRYRHSHGQWLNNIEITQALAPWPLTRFALHQRADGSLRLRVDASQPLENLAQQLHGALLPLFGAAMRLHIEPLAADDKVRQYTTDLTP